MSKPAQISVPHSVIPASEPDVTQMADGELALNRASGRLYFKNSSGNLDYFVNFNTIETAILNLIDTSLVNLIDDSSQSQDTTWSSDKIQDELNNKSNIGHVHDINDIQNLQTELNNLQTATSTAPLTRIRYRSLQDQGDNPSLYQHIQVSTSSSAYLSDHNWTFGTSSPGFTQTWNINNFHVNDGAPEDIRAIYVSIKWRVRNDSISHRTSVSTRYPFFFGNVWFPLLDDVTRSGPGFAAAQSNAGIVRIPVVPQQSNQFQLNYRTRASTGDIESQILGVECHEQVQISV